MESLPREVLRQLLERYGRYLVADRRRLKGLLLDMSGDNRPEINLILQAQEARVSETLLKHGALIPLTLVMGQLQNRMEITYYTAPAAAIWAVEIWVVPGDDAAGACTGDTAAPNKTGDSSTYTRVEHEPKDRDVGSGGGDGLRSGTCGAVPDGQRPEERFHSP